MEELKTSKLDIGIIVIFTTLSILLFNIPLLNNLEIMTFLKIIIFFLPGYSLLIMISSSKDINNLKFFLASILSSIIIVFALALTLGVFLKFNSETFINTLLIITNTFIAIAYIKRVRLSKRKLENEYIACKSCGSFYKLKEGESLDDFETCRCGGELKYVKIDLPKFTGEETKKRSLFNSKSVMIILFIILSGIILNSLIGTQLTFIVISLIILILIGFLLKSINYNVFNHRFFINFSKYKYLLVELVKRDIKVKYRRSVLGIFWSFLNPLFTLIVLYIIFSTFFARDIPNFPVYLLTGRIVFDVYAQGSNAAMLSIKKNASIIKKVYVPKYMYSLGVVLSSFVTFGLSLIVLFLVMIITHAPFTIYILYAILPIILLFMFTLGAGLLLATVTVFFRDIEHLYGVFITLLLYGSAIFYPIEIVPEQYRILFELNPIFAIITLFRDSFMYGRTFDPTTLLFAAASSIVILVLGIAVFYKYQDKFILYI